MAENTLGLIVSQLKFQESLLICKAAFMLANVPTANHAQRDEFRMYRKVSDNVMPLHRFWSRLR